MRYLVVNWAEYQHYRDRCPPWIRLHNSLLTSRLWVAADDASRVIAVASMLLASRDKAGDGSFDGDPEYVRRVCYLNQLPDFGPLVKAEFLTPLADASTPLAKCITETEQRQSRAEADTERAGAHEKPPTVAEVVAVATGMAGIPEPFAREWHATMERQGWKDNNGRPCVFRWRNLMKTYWQKQQESDHKQKPAAPAPRKNGRDMW